MTYRLRAYGGLAALQARTVLTYRADYLFGLVGVLLQVFLLKVVWTAVYAQAGSDRIAVNGGSAQITLSMQIAYATLASLQYWLLSPWSFTTTHYRIRDGKIAIDLLRPLRFLEQTLAGQVGATVAMLPFVLVALPLAVLIGGAQAPESVMSGLAYAGALVLAYTISTLVNAVVGLVPFWTLEVQGIFMIYRMLAQFLAGALVPLWFMPDWLRTIAEWLPFQATTYTPMAVYLGQVEGVDVFGALALQLFWCVVLWFLLRIIWSRALRRVVVQGG
ncbi:ABC transporter permease [Flindersiella endophytica]